MAIMSSKKEIAESKKTTDKLPEWVHHRTADLYSRELEKLQQQRQEQEQKVEGQ